MLFAVVFSNAVSDHSILFLNKKGIIMRHTVLILTDPHVDFLHMISEHLIKYKVSHGMDTDWGKYKGGNISVVTIYVTKKDAQKASRLLRKLFGSTDYAALYEVERYTQLN